MKLYINIISLCLLYMAAGCTPSAKEDGLGHNHDHHHHTEHDHTKHDHTSEHKHTHGPECKNHNHDHNEHEHDSEASHADEIILSSRQAAQFGVETTKIRPGSFHNVIKVSGQIIPAVGSEGIVTAPSAGIVKFMASLNVGSSVRQGQRIAYISGKGLAGGDSNENAAIEYEAAKRELERITPLHADGIVSTSSYNAALRAFESAEAAYSGHRNGSNAIVPINGVITGLSVAEGQYVDAGAPIAKVSGCRNLTLRADLPERDAAYLSEISSARFRTTSSSNVFDLKDLGGKMITMPVSAMGDGTRQGYVPIYFSFNNTDGILSGSYADVYLLMASRNDVISLPKEAIVEQQGSHFAYVRLDEEGYEKRKVTLGLTDGLNVEILDGLHSGDEVVTKGAIAVKLAESSGAVPEGHSHNH